jgi:NADH-quinone oxidoreductase subunit G
MKLLIDQRVIEANDGETVLQAAQRNGIEIPHFCYHDKLSVAGSCRMCLVKINGLPKLMPACNVVVAPKMSVETNVEEIQRARRHVLQFILLNHPVDCGICDKAGECRLQEYQHRYGPSESRSVEAKQTNRKLHELSPRILLDNERCILCSRCVRFTREISGSNALGIVARGQHAYVECAEAKPFDDPYSDNVIDLCPVGALLSRDFLYECRVWFLEAARSVCTGCARGCSIKVWRRKKLREQRMPGAVKKNQAYRVTAFDNPEINGPWLCNTGFDRHHWMARERLPQPLVDGRPAAVDEALAVARRLLSGAQRPAALVSAHASNAELDAFAAVLGSRFSVYANEDCVPVPGDVLDDHLLIRADKNPNRQGVAARFGDRPFDPAAGHDVVLVWGEIPPAQVPANAPWIHLTPFGTPADARAAVAFPISNTFERSGSFTNFLGKENVFEAVFDKPANVEHAADLFGRLAW